MSSSVATAQWLKLRCHPGSSCAAISDVQVTLQRLSPTQLRLQYQVAGELKQIRVPAIAMSERRDELWRHTCAELFLGAPGKQSYVEFNFSPSTCWAAYEFSDYRQDMLTANVATPVVMVAQVGPVLEIAVTLDLPQAFADVDVLQASLTMVIEDHAGQHSYWAVQHAAAKPDFHCRDSFVVSI